MNQATAELNNYRQSPRKVRVVARSIRGKKVGDAGNILTFLTKKATGPLHKLLNSAVSNAKNLGLEVKDLKVKSITVDGGSILYRRRPVSHGAAHPVRKRTSHVKIILSAISKA
ncbi:MAG: 50S ribosomal protein L22 [Patescibacteria group bacterium]